MSKSAAIRRFALALGALLALAAVVVVPAMAGDGSGTDTTSKEKTVLRIGWAQNPSTINPFVGLDEEAYTIWAMNWDLLVNFSPKDLSPYPGIAKSWKVSDGGKTVTFKLDPDAKWSDGKPVTSADVKYSLEVLGGNGALFTSYTDNVTAIETPDAQTVVIKTSKPDTRIVGGMFIYILPKHIWGKVPVNKLTGSYQPEVPLVGTGPYVVTDFERGKITKLDRNPYFRGPAPKFDEIQFITYGNQDAVERALKLGEIDLVAEVQASTFDQLGNEPNIDTFRSSTPAFTELAFNLCQQKFCPDAKFNPAIQDRAVRQAIAYAVDRNRINEIAARGTSYIGHGLLPEFYKSFYEQPAQDYNPPDIARANRILDQAGYTRQGDGVRSKNGDDLSFNLYVRSESPFNIQAAKLVAEEADKIGVHFDVQVVSTDKLTELTVQQVNGKPAPDFDTFIWGWGGDPYDPSFLLGLLTTGEIGNSSDSFYSNPAYDALYRKQSTQFDTAARRATIQKMIAISQRDLPYLVLTYDPNLQAYRTDRIGNVSPQCPEDDTGDILCEQVGYAPLLTITPTSADSAGGGSSTGIIIAVAVVVAGGIVYLIVRSRRRRGEALEIEE
ncbi:MAG: peptide ABC transporter substrate-binding protein [Solirubrobacterales bacterium]